MHKLNTQDKKLAVLIDPDKTSELMIDNLFAAKNIENVDLFLVGGSLLFNDFDQFLGLVKQKTTKPVVVFPGNALQVSRLADAIMLLNLISGRNPDFLIGHHVMVAPKLKEYEIDILSTGYMLFGCGKTTSVQYMSNTTPLPVDKPDIAVATALAGQMIGMSQLYLEAGSGADFPVPEEIISAVCAQVNIPVIVGGGIRTAEQALTAWQAGANMVVVGNATEHDPNLIDDFVNARATLQ